MALGASKALKALSRSDIGISGFDGTWLGKNAVNSGLFISTFDTLAEEMGREIVRLAAATLNAPDVFLSRKLDGKLFTGDSNEKETKQTSSIRRYPIVIATDTLEEWHYEKLGETVDCPVVFGSSLEIDIAPRLQRIGPDRAIIVTDETVRAIYGQRLLESFRKVNLNARIYSFKGGEESKTAPVLHELADQILTDGISKRSVIVTLGGGIVNNVAGFLAAILLRGIRFIHVPTSTMSQLDVVIGGKQAVNTRHGKNLLGTFYEPEFIYLNTQLVETLPTREYYAGLAEAVKHGLCQSKRLLDLVRRGDYRDILSETLRLKIGLIHEDPREYQRGLILLYGHTLGHAFEIASNHALNHGEAISIGMVGEAMISQKLGLCSKEFVQLHRDIFSYLRLPTELPRGVGLGRILDALSYDKKERHTDHQFCLLHDVAKPVRVNGSFRISVPERLIEEVILDLCESMEDAESVDLSRKVG
jgi:3-dehydroquinate synthetase